MEEDENNDYCDCFRSQASSKALLTIKMMKSFEEEIFTFRDNKFE